MAEYISRDDAIKKALNACIMVVGHGISQIDAVDIADEIERIPPADVAEVRHGHWIDKPSGRYLHMGSFCSVCGEKSGIGGIESNRHKPYCPNCGAKMDGKGEDNGNL